MKHSVSVAEIISGQKTVRKFPPIPLFMLFIIGLAGVPEDIFTWGRWLKKVLPLSDYLFGIIMGAVVTVLAYETSLFLAHLFKGVEPRPDISLSEIMQRALTECESPTFDVPGFGDVLWNALASNRITAWGREKVSPGYGYADDVTLWPEEEKIPTEYWKFNKVDLNTAGLFEGDSESTYGDKGKKTYNKLRFNVKQLENARIFNSGFKRNQQEA